MPKKLITSHTLPVRVISFNLEYDAAAYGATMAAELIASTGANIVLLQEVKTRGAEIASILNYYCVLFEKSSTAILSSLPVVKISEGEHYGLAKIGDVYCCVVHLSDQPYLPFEASGIRYPAECSIGSCFYSSDPILLQQRSLQKRKKELKELVLALTSSPVREGDKIVVGGDFNEPSHLDWTDEVADEGRIPFPIRFPCTVIMEELGFTDAFRKIHPNVLRNSGYTWPDREVEYESRRDRIDFIFVKHLRPKDSRVIPTKVSDHSIILTDL